MAAASIQVHLEDFPSAQLLLGCELHAIITTWWLVMFCLMSARHFIYHQWRVTSVQHALCSVQRQKPTWELVGPILSNSEHWKLQYLLIALFSADKVLKIHRTTWRVIVSGSVLTLARYSSSSLSVILQGSLFFSRSAASCSMSSSFRRYGSIISSKANTLYNNSLRVNWSKWENTFSHLVWF